MYNDLEIFIMIPNKYYIILHDKDDNFQITVTEWKSNKINHYEKKSSVLILLWDLGSNLLLETVKGGQKPLFYHFLFLKEIDTFHHKKLSSV